MRRLAVTATEVQQAKHSTAHNTRPPASRPSSTTPSDASTATIRKRRCWLCGTRSEDGLRSQLTPSTTSRSPRARATSSRPNLKCHHGSSSSTSSMCASATRCLPRLTAPCLLSPIINSSRPLQRRKRTHTLTMMSSRPLTLSSSRSSPCRSR